MSHRLRPLLALLMLAAASALVLAGAQHLLGSRIAAARERAAMAAVFEVMPLPFDNDMLADRRALPGLPQPETAYAFRARRGAEPVGVVVTPVIARGYNGPITLAVGIARDGTLTGVRVVRHGETPGLGDQVDQRHGPWTAQFMGKSLAGVPPERWAVVPDGGEFDAISGATITPRGIVRAIRALLEYHGTAPDDFYQ